MVHESKTANIIFEFEREVKTADRLLNDNGFYKVIYVSKFSRTLGPALEFEIP